MVTGQFKDEDVARFAPFDELDLELKALWADGVP